MSGHLVVTEIKTGTYVFAADHLLQVWGYCMSAPGAVMRVTDGNFRANTIEWSLEYPTRGTTYGPYPFTEKALALTLDAMRLHEKLFLAGAGSKTYPGERLYGPSPRKCPPCAFYHTCPWRYRGPRKPTISVTD